MSISRVFRRYFGSLTDVTRGNYAKISSKDVDYFGRIIDNSNNNAILSSENISNKEMESYNMDWLKKYKGKSDLVLKPKTTNEVSKILSYCNDNNIAVSLQGGNTGLVGGSVPIFDEIILNMSRMNNIISFDELSGILTCESGCILQETDNYLRNSNIPHLFPLDLGAKGSCHIGGNIATNAGGLRLVRYGNLHGSVLGLEVVLPNGEILNLLNNNRKDNTGYDLKQLFIGSEGTLGVITKATILCPKLCNSTNLMFISVNSFEDVLKILLHARVDLNEILSAIEFIDNNAISYPINHLHASYPLSERNSFYMVIETQGSNSDHDQEKLNSFIEKLFELELINDGTIAEDTKQFDMLWKLREGVGPSINEANKACYKYDISLPLDQMYNIVVDCRQRIQSQYSDYANVDIMGYGHLGDGNLHLNVAYDKWDIKLENILEPWIYEWCYNVNGSISAEHGVGQMKPNVLHYTKSKESIAYMKSIKSVFDPNNILNPYKVLPQDIIS